MIENIQQTALVITLVTLTFITMFKADELSNLVKASVLGVFVVSLVTTISLGIYLIWA